METGERSRRTEAGASEVVEHVVALHVVQVQVQPAEAEAVQLLASVVVEVVHHVVAHVAEDAARHHERRRRQPEQRQERKEEHQHYQRRRHRREHQPLRVERRLVVLPVQQEVHPDAPLGVRRRVVVEDEPVDQVLEQRPQQDAEHEHRRYMVLADLDACAHQTR